MIYLVDPDGTILFITRPLAAAHEAGTSRNDSEDKEIWLRMADGDYVKVAATPHYEMVNNGEVIYWVPSTRQYHAFSIVTRQTRTAPEFRCPDYVDVTEGVILSGDHKGLE